MPHRITKLQRWNRKIVRVSDRFSTYRFVAFSVGVVVTWLVFNFAGDTWGWLALAASILGFLFVVWRHQAVDRYVRLSEARLDIERTQFARRTLDWDNIPEPVPQESGKNALQVDLDLVGARSLHHLMDNTVSDAASKRLAESLSQDRPDLEAIRERQQLVSELTPMYAFRIRLALLQKLDWEGRFDPNLLQAWIERPAPLQQIRRILPLAAFLAIANICLFILNLLGMLPPVWVLSLGAYALVYFLNFNRLSEYMAEIVRVNGELSKLRSVLVYLEGHSYRGKPHLRQFCAPFHSAAVPPSDQLRRVSLATAAVGLRTNPVMALLINTLVPWDFTFAYLAAVLKEDIAQVLPTWLEIWVELEVLNALANFAYLNPDYRFAEVAEEADEFFTTRAIGHPLIPKDQVVCNDFSIDGHGGMAIITGSNMAGKSTFLKTVGINLCLAYAGAPVFAEELRFHPVRLHTCMKISDSIVDGYSYFYAEVRCLKALQRKVEADEALPVFFLIDEIFRGTNNRERLIGSRAYIRSMIGKQAAGMIATHDLELATLAEESPAIANYHFRDRVEGNQLVFDYRIHPGPSPTTNALRIMRMEGLPVDDLLDDTLGY